MFKRLLLKIILVKVLMFLFSLNSFTYAYDSYGHMAINPHIQKKQDNTQNKCEGVSCFEFSKNTAFVSSPLPLGQWRTLNAWVGVNAKPKQKEVSDTQTIIKDFREDVHLIYGVTSSSNMIDMSFTKAINNSLNMSFDDGFRKDVTLRGVTQGHPSIELNPSIPAISTVAMYTGEAINNSLNIKNVNFNLTFNESSSIYTAFIAKPSVGYNEWFKHDKVKLNGNSLNLYNVGISSSPFDLDKHTTQLGAAFVNTSSASLWYGKELPVEMNYNSVNIDKSDLDVGVITAAYSDMLSMNGDMVTDHNSITINDSNLEIGSVDIDNTYTSGIMASGTSDTAKFNKVSINNSNLSFGSAGYSSVIAAAFDATSHADYNYLSIKDTNINTIGSGNLLSKISIYAGAANTSHNMLDTSRSACFNTIEISSSDESKYLNWDTADDTIVNITGGLALVKNRSDLTKKNDISKANFNSVYINNLKANNVSVAGGKIFTNEYAQGMGSSEGNFVSIENSIFNHLDVTGAFSRRGSSEYNQVSLYDIDVLEKLTLIGGETLDYGYANGNIILLENSRIADGGEIIGGIVRETGFATDLNKAMGNSVIIGEKVTSTTGDKVYFDKIYGGMLDAHKGQASFYSNNSLYVASNIITKELGGFQLFRFNLNDYIDYDKPLITVTDKPVAVVYDQSQDQNSIVSITSSNETLPDRIVLIHSDNGFVTDHHDMTHCAKPGDISHLLGLVPYIKQVQSLSRVSNYKVDRENLSLSIENVEENDSRHIIYGQNLVLGFKDKDKIDVITTINKATDPLMESSLSNIATLFKADDLFFDSLIRSRDKSLEGIFVSTKGGRESIDTNNRIDLDSFNALLGYGFEIPSGQIGLFTQIGHSNYDTYSFESSGAKAPGHGNHNHISLSLFVNKELYETGINLSSYLKLGSLRNDFKTSIEGNLVDFDKTSGYIGAHIGLIKDISIQNDIMARSFLSYYYNYVDGNTYEQESINNVAGSKFVYDSINAHKISTGTQLNFNITENFSAFSSISLDYVLDAKASGYAKDHLGVLPLNSSNMNGSTVALDCGFKYIHGDFEVSTAVSGFLGNSNGADIQFQSKYLF